MTRRTPEQHAAMDRRILRWIAENPGRFRSSLILALNYKTGLDTFPGLDLDPGKENWIRRRLARLIDQGYVQTQATYRLDGQVRLKLTEAGRLAASTVKP